MKRQNWQWKIGEAIERIRTRYHYIGRKTGAPFLAVVYPPEAETAVFLEWHNQAATLAPDFEVKTINILEVTHTVLTEIGIENVVSSLRDPMPGSDPEADLGNIWISTVASTIKTRLAEHSLGKPVISLERLATLYPVCGARNLMQELWGSEQFISFDVIVLVLIHGYIEGARTYSFIGQKSEFMYRGDLL